VGRCVAARTAAAKAMGGSSGGPSGHRHKGGVQEPRQHAAYGGYGGTGEAVRGSSSSRRT